MSDYLSGFDDWTKAFEYWSDVSVSELHGIMTAVVCACKPPTQDEWARFLGELSFEIPDDNALALLTQYGEDVAYGLQDKGEAFEFEPLLPDDEHTLFERLIALKDWAGGFISGIGMTDIHLSDDERELIYDLSKIASIRPDDTADNTDDFVDDDLMKDGDDDLAYHQSDKEETYFHLYEFARMVPVAFMVRHKKSIMDLALIKGLDMTRKTAQEIAQANLPPVIDAMNTKH